MFDSFRQTLRDLMDRATPPEERRAGLARMKQTLVTARMGLDDLRAAVATTRARLETERRELETVRRRKGLAAGIADTETVALAEKYEKHHAERAQVYERKLEAQEAELLIVEREVAEMAAELKGAMLGTATPSSTLGADARAAAAAADDAAGDTSGIADELDALGRARARSERDADAERRLAELKRRMGK
jgi:hypothetical protein